MVIGDHELDAAEPPSAQPLEEGGPKGPVLGIAHLDAEHLTVALGRDAGGHDDRARDHPAAHAALHVGGVGEDVGEGDVVQTAFAELGRALCRVPHKSG